MKTITVSNEIIFQKQKLNEKVYLSDLPEFKDLSVLYNTVFNKSVTGIGGTSLALDSKENIIILMPFVEVVKNKENYNLNTFCVKESVTVQSIVKYLKTTKIRKIVATYDALFKLIEAYDRVGLNIYNDFLLIDEWQVIFQQFGFRNKVMRYLLNESVKFTNKCFMTATPISKEYWFDELQGLDELVLEYNLPKTKLVHFKCNDVVDEVSALINSKQDNRNLHFFINSVQLINIIVKTNNLLPNEVRIVCSKQSKNELKLSGYTIESTTSLPKKYNFYTSTAFEGCDLYDTQAQIFVVADGNKAHSLCDITTTLPQIAGRIRDAKDNTINLIYKTTRYIDVTQEEFERVVKNNLEEGERIAKGITYSGVTAIINDLKANDYYLRVTDEGVVFEKVLLNLDRFQFNLSKTYSLKANIIMSTQTIFESEELDKEIAEKIQKYRMERIAKASFREKCIAYAEYPYLFGVVEKEVREAVRYLGIDKLNEMNFNKTNIKRALLQFSDKTKVNQILSALPKYRVGDFIPANELVFTFNNIYNLLNIDKLPKASDIANYFEVKTTTKRIDGKVAKGVIIINQKVKINE